MTRLIIPLLAAIALPTAVNAGIEREIAEFCLKAEDFSGCVKEMSAEKKPVLKKINKDIKIGVCGEHAGDPKSIKFLNTLDIDYISCSPFRIPTARLAAAQAEIS